VLKIPKFPYDRVHHRSKKAPCQNPAGYVKSSKVTPINKDDTNNEEETEYNEAKKHNTTGRNDRTKYTETNVDNEHILIQNSV